MERYTKEQHVIIVKTHYKYGESYAETVRKVREILGGQNALSINS
jgi:ABC-type branched-subunit amino acid transport system substrate-binding protein